MKPPDRFRDLELLALVSVGVGAAASLAALVMAGAVPLVYRAVESEIPEPPHPDQFAVERALSPTPAPPGRSVRVELTVTNESDRRVSDIRVVDGVPDGLAVTGGSPRGAARLEPGASLSIVYTVTAHRGRFPFDPPSVRTRSRLGATVVTDSVPASGDDVLRCRLDVRGVPLRDRGRVETGLLSADEAGDGIQFHSLREYRPGDPARRIDWRQYAKHGELATVRYREDQSATVMMVLDARQLTDVVPTRGGPGAVELCAYVMMQAADLLTARGHDVGLAVIGPEYRHPDRGFLVPPAAGQLARRRIRDGLQAACRQRPNQRDAVRVMQADLVRKLLARAPDDAQLLWSSPVIDDAPLEWLDRARTADYPNRLVSPQVCSLGTAGGMLERLDRQSRLVRCRSGTDRVVDWDRRTPLASALTAAIDGGR